MFNFGPLDPEQAFGTDGKEEWKNANFIGR